MKAQGNISDFVKESYIFLRSCPDDGIVSLSYNSIVNKVRIMTL